MPSPIPFAVFKPEGAPGHARSEATREPEARARGHAEEARGYLAPEPLVDALNVAWHTGAPLLLTGEPGTGKTQAAYWAAQALEAGVQALFVTSRTTSQELLYSFDRVGQFHAAHDPAAPLARADFRKPGPLWRAFDVDGPSVVLIDEVDKAPRDFPNDLLHVLDQHEFEVAPSDHDPDEATALPWVIRQRWHRPPLVVVTSNSERRLPEAFLRRCIFHHLVLTPGFVDQVVARRRPWFPTLPDDAVAVARRRFEELRARKMSKVPATAELLLWLTVLSAKGIGDAAALEGPLGELPGISCLVKHGPDLEALPRSPST